MIPCNLAQRGDHVWLRGVNRPERAHGLHGEPRPSGATEWESHPPCVDFDAGPAAVTDSHESRCFQTYTHKVFLR